MKNRKLRNSLIALSLVAVVGIGGTLAYLSATTGEKVNTFTMGKGITGETIEPGWKEENALNFTPGKVIVKDPSIKNTSELGTDAVYAAATIKYQIKNEEGAWVDATFDKLDKFINIKHGESLADGFNTIDWTLQEGNKVAYYTKDKVACQSATTNLFDAVEIDKLALTPEQVASAETELVQFSKGNYEVKDAEGNVTSYNYESYEMCDFQIIVQGYLVQGSDEFTDCQTAMQSAFPDVFQ